MLTTLRDAEGRLIAACEWWLVDSAGVRSYGPAAQYVWVNQLELNGQDVASVRHMIHAIAAEAPYAKGAYWERREKTGTKLHAFRRDQLVRGGMQHAAV